MAMRKYSREEALRFHLEPNPGKLEVNATVPMATQRDLSLAYSPGVAVPCVEIAENPQTAFDYTAKGNLVAVVSNGRRIATPKLASRPGPSWPTFMMPSPAPVIDIQPFSAMSLLKSTAAA